MQEEEIIKDDAALWHETRNTPVQDYDVPDNTEIPDFVATDTSEEDVKTEYITDKQVKSELNQLKLSEPLANLIVILIDTVLPNIVCAFSPQRGEDREDLKVRDDEKELLIDAFSQYLKTTNVSISPSGILITAILSVYAPKFVNVFYFKKKQHADQMQAIQAQNELLREQNEMLKNGTPKD
jgi:hypothetical protein